MRGPRHFEKSPLFPLTCSGPDSSSANKAAIDCLSGLFVIRSFTPGLFYHFYRFANISCLRNSFLAKTAIYFWGENSLKMIRMWVWHNRIILDMTGASSRVGWLVISFLAFRDTSTPCLAPVLFLGHQWDNNLVLSVGNRIENWECCPVSLLIIRSQSLSKMSTIRHCHVFVTILHICHNHHNRWLCKKIQSGVKFLKATWKKMI